MKRHSLEQEKELTGSEVRLLGVATDEGLGLRTDR